MIRVASTCLGSLRPFEGVISMLYESGMALSFWGEALAAFVHVVMHRLYVGVITDTLVITELRGVRVVQIP